MFSVLTKKLYPFIFLFILGLFFASLPVRAADVSPDAIAIRVMPNKENLSPLAWYYNNVNIKGAPQSLVVDGYDAVRDGRTVYVSAANIAPSPMGDWLYMNVYIISFNQEAEDNTKDIFGQILQYWKFNIELSDPGVCQPKSQETCDVTTGCVGKFMDHACEDDGSGSFTCVKKCLLNSECSYGQYCDSQKAKLIRDIKRMIDLRDAKLAIENYKVKNKKYPALPSGSYLPNKSTSVWPSWNETLGRILGVRLPLDPINKLKNCPAGFDAITCWNELEKKYATDFGNPIFPEGSFAFAYSWDPKSDIYRLCGNFETRYLGIPRDIVCQSGYIAPPGNGRIEVRFGKLTAKEGSFRDYFAVNSQYPIDWSSLIVDTVPANAWGDWYNRGWRWSAGANKLKVEDIKNFENQKALVANSITLLNGRDSDFFDLKITVNDIYGNIGSNEGIIKICNPTTCAAKGAQCGRLPSGCRMPNSSPEILLCGDCTDQNKPDCVNNKCIKL
jgi:hypothetical protein